MAALDLVLSRAGSDGDGAGAGPGGLPPSKGLFDSALLVCAAEYQVGWAGAGQAGALCQGPRGRYQPRTTCSRWPRPAWGHWAIHLVVIRLLERRRAPSGPFTLFLVPFAYGPKHLPLPPAHPLTPAG